MTARLDVIVAARGLARSRTHAQSLIADGRVHVNGRVVTKPALHVDDDALVDVRAPDGYVGRAAYKLVAALDAFDVPVAGRTALDMGASTGGFTQVLRERGARPVIAVDVGHGQLAPAVEADPGVIGVEGFNVRHMTASALRHVSGVADAPGVVCGDLSFISLRLVLPAVRAVCAADADIVLLVKPQFEAGRGAGRGGVVTDRARRADAVTGVLWAAWDQRLGTCGVIASPITGEHGNQEYVVHLRASGGTDPSEWMGRIDDVTGGRR